MDSPYHPPESEPRKDVILAARCTKGRPLAIIGLTLMTGPVFGILGTIYAMSGAFAKLGHGGGSDSEYLARQITLSLYSTAIGVVAGLIGAAMVLTAIFAFRNRERWLYIPTLILSGLWGLFLFPVGLVVGGFIITLLIQRRGEFFPEVNLTE